MKIPPILPIFFLSLFLTACDNDNNSSVEALLQSYTLSSQDSIPEGIAFDPRERAFYATSLEGGSITKIEADGTETVFRQADGRESLGGVKVDADRRLLWVCATQVDATDDRVWVYDLESGELEQEYFLSALSTDARCNDLVLDDDGTAYVTDPANPFIYKLDLGTGEGEVFAMDPLFRDITGIGLGLNGIAISPDGSALIVAKVAPATLLRVTLPDAAEISPLNLSGDTLPSPDGLVVFNGDIYSTSNSAVSRIRLQGATDGTVVNRTQKSGLSTATIAEGMLYVIKSEVVNHVLNQPIELPFEIFRVEFETFDTQ